MLKKYRKHLILIKYSMRLLAVLAISSSSLAEIQISSPNAAPNAQKNGLLEHQRPPNIVLILLDDTGFAASSTFGGAVQTPVLDKLASEGLRYNNFHTAASCSPTRAALLSGRNHHRIGFGTISELAQDHPGYNNIWKKDAASVAEILRRNGYSTAAFGKWHNTSLEEISPIGPFDRWPTGLGFEYFYGFIGGEANQWTPPLYRNTYPVEAPDSPAGNYHLTTDITNEAIQWIQTNSAISAEKPYFLYLAPGATHAPHHVPQEWIAKYQGQFDKGWDELREEIFQKQKRIGIIPAETKLTPRPQEIPAWNTLTSKEQQLYARQMEVFAGFLTHTDHEIGRLLETIQQQPNGQNTLIFYIVGDNGAATPAGITGSDADFADSFFGQSNSIDNQLLHIDGLGGPLYDNNYSIGWAWMTNTPFKGAKGSASHFGGIRNPLVINWPGHIKGPGKIRGQFTHVVDIVPTILEAAHIPLPSKLDGVTQLTLDGESISHTFSSETKKSTNRTQYFEMAGNLGIYKNGWFAAKMRTSPWVSPNKKSNIQFDWELYHVDVDFSQANDISSKNPGKLAELRALFDSEAERNHVYPIYEKPSGSSSTLTPGAKFTYFKGTPRLPIKFSPPLSGSHRVSADLELTDKSQGVILAGGGTYGGYTLYIRENRLIYENNFFGKHRDILVSTTEIPSGKINVGYEFTRQDFNSWGGGMVSLFINGQPAGNIYISKVGLPSLIDSFDVGADRGSPVSINYKPPFSLGESLKKVVITLKKTDKK